MKQYVVQRTTKRGWHLRSWQWVSGRRFPPRHTYPETGEFGGRGRHHFLRAVTGRPCCGHPKDRQGKGRQRQESATGRGSNMRTHWWALVMLGAAALAETLTDTALEPLRDTSQLTRRSAGVKTSRRGHKKIYKGKLAKAKEYPFQVYVRVFLENGEKEYCGGAIIGPRHIISAAHCVKIPKVQKVCSIVGNEHRFNKQTLKFTVVRQHFYPKKSNETVDADIVVFLVDRPIPIGKPNIQQIRLLGTMQQRMPTNTKCSVSGWGRSDNPMDDQNLMRHTKVPIVSQEQCRTAYPNSPTGDLLCAGFYEKGGADACKGDSGGPLVCNGYLTGLVKSGRGCGLPYYPGTYTDVRYYWTWIKAVMTEDLRKEAPTKTGRRIKHINIC